MIRGERLKDALDRSSNPSRIDDDSRSDSMSKIGMGFFATVHFAVGRVVAV